MQDQILRLPKVMELTGKSRTTLWRDEREGRFPKRVKIGPRAVGWLRSSVEKWLQELKEAQAN